MHADLDENPSAWLDNDGNVIPYGRAVAVDPTRRYLFVAEEDAIHQYDIALRKRKHTWPVPAMDGWHNDGVCIAVQSKRELIIIYNYLIEESALVDYEAERIGRFAIAGDQLVLIDAMTLWGVNHTWFDPAGKLTLSHHNRHYQF